VRRHDRQKRLDLAVIDRHIACIEVGSIGLSL